MGGTQGIKNVEKLKISELISDEQKRQLRRMTKKKETLSEKDILELMGVNRDMYKRVKGFRTILKRYKREVGAM